VKELFFQFRNIYKNIIKDVENKNFIDTKAKDGGDVWHGFI
jgi:kinesin family protein 6/9